MSSTDRTAGEIDWPAWAERTPPRKRERTHKFKVGLGRAIDDIEKELEDRLEVDDWRLSTAAPHRKDDGRPYADVVPDDPGAVVRWSKGGAQYAVAADGYSKLRDNVRAIGLYIEEKRIMGNRPVKTGQDEFATARLPSGDENGDSTGRRPASERPHKILGVDPDAPEGVIEAAARELSKEHHPDRGGDLKQFKRIQRAKEEMLGE